MEGRTEGIIPRGQLNTGNGFISVESCKPAAVKPEPKEVKKRKSSESDLFADDDDFESMMQDMDFDENMGL
jgi:hypothetical protein